MKLPAHNRSGAGVDVTYFRPRRNGPEAAIEDAVAAHARDLIVCASYKVWAAGSLPVGAGMPDLTVVSYRHPISRVFGFDPQSAEVLGYLRAVRRARLDTIVDRVRRSMAGIVDLLDDLVGIGVVRKEKHSYALDAAWRDILPEIVTVEAKVSNWRRAVDQAGRNRLFAHRSYVALPTAAAKRMQDHCPARDWGIGIIAVANDGSVRVLRRARQHSPRVWTYYYQIALSTAGHSERGADAI